MVQLAAPTRSVRLAGKTLIDVESTPVETLAEFIDGELPGALSPMELQIAGEADLKDVITAVANAEQTLETVVAVRDKVLAAYNEILKMPI